jgi:hypothetical protein
MWSMAFLYNAITDFEAVGCHGAQHLGCVAGVKRFVAGVDALGRVGEPEVEAVAKFKVCLKLIGFRVPPLKFRGSGFGFRVPSRFLFFGSFVIWDLFDI